MQSSGEDGCTNGTRMGAQLMAAVLLSMSASRASREERRKSRGPRIGESANLPYGSMQPHAHVDSDARRGFGAEHFETQSVVSELTRESIFERGEHVGGPKEKDKDDLHSLVQSHVRQAMYTVGDVLDEGWKAPLNPPAVGVWPVDHADRQAGSVEPGGVFL